MSGLHFNVGISDADQIGHQLSSSRDTLRSVVLRMLLKAYIFHLAKSPGNSSPYIDRADIITRELLAITPWVLGRCLDRILLTLCCCTRPIPWPHWWWWTLFPLSLRPEPAVDGSNRPICPRGLLFRVRCRGIGKRRGRWCRGWYRPSRKWKLSEKRGTVLIFFSWNFGLLKMQSRKVPISDTLWCPLGKEVNVILIVLELSFLFEVGFGLSLCGYFFFLLDSQFLEILVPPLVGVDVFGILFYPGDCFFFGDLHLVFFCRLHCYY